MKSPFKGWEPIKKPPRWVNKILIRHGRKRGFATGEIKDVKGRHYIYRAWNNPSTSPGHVELDFFRKKRYHKRRKRKKMKCRCIRCRFMRWLSNILYPQPKGIKIMVPDGIDSKPGNQRSKDYYKYKRSYSRKDAMEIGMIHEGRKIRFWKKILSHDDFAFDEYVPIYYRRRKTRIKAKRKK